MQEVPFEGETTVYSLMWNVSGVATREISSRQRSWQSINQSNLIPKIFQISFRLNVTYLNSSISYRQTIYSSQPEQQLKDLTRTSNLFECILSIQVLIEKQLHLVFFQRPKWHCYSCYLIPLGQKFESNQIRRGSIIILSEPL